MVAWNRVFLDEHKLFSGSEKILLEKEGARYLREVFIPRRQAFTAIAFQAAKDRGEIPPETDIKFLMDLLYGYSLFRLITEQIDDDQIPDRIGATIAKLARSGISKAVHSQIGREPIRDDFPSFPG